MKSLTRHAGQSADSMSASDHGGSTGSTAFDLRVFVSMVIGLSFLWPCLGSFVTMRFRHVIHDSSFLIEADWYVVIMSVIYLIALVIVIASRHRIARVLASSYGVWMALGVGAIGLIGHALLIASPHFGIATTPLVFIGFICSIVFIVGHIIAWGSLLSGGMPLAVLLVVVSSNALSYGLNAIIDLIPGNAMLYYLLICPLGSAAGLVAVTTLMSYQTQNTTSVVSSALKDGALLADASRENMSIGHALKGLPWQLLVPTIVLVYFEQAFSSILFQRHGDWSRDYLTVTLTICCIVWLVAAVAIYSCRSNYNQLHNSNLMQRRVLLGLFAGLLVIYMAALLVTVVFPDTLALIPERVLVAAGSCMRIFIWCLVAVAVCEGTTTPVIGYSVGILFALAIPVSRFVALFASQVNDPTLLEALTSPRVIVPVAGSILFVIATTIIVANVRETSRLMTETQQAAAQAQAASEEAAAARETARAAEAEVRPYANMAQQAGLSAREAEVFELLCQGYSAKRIGERLSISESTVVSHTTHIYRKFNVSSKQELIALVDNARDEKDEAR